MKVNEHSRARSFGLGVAAGVMLSAAFVTGIGGALALQGVRLRVDTVGIAALVQEQVELEARKELPTLLRRLAADAPKALVSRLNSRGGITVRMLGVEMKLPRALVKEVDRQIARRLAVAVGEAISTYDVEPLVSIAGLSARNLVRDSLENDLKGRTFPVRIYPWFTVPVSVEAH